MIRRRPIGSLIALTILPGGLFAQSMAGTWQGTVRSPEDSPARRTVLTIASADGTPIKGNFYSIDQTYIAFPFTLTVQGAVVKIEIPGIGAGYEGKLSADGNTISGAIKKGFPTAVPWILKRVTKEDEAWAIPQAPAPPKPMAADADPVFEVATVKLSPPDARGRGGRVQGGTFTVTGFTLADLVAYAYDVHAHQIIGAPAWFSTQRYDIAGKSEGEGTPSNEQWKIMLRKLLAERFQLGFHRDRQALAVYTLGVSKSGLKISKSESKNETPAIISRGAGSLSLNFESMADLCRLLQGGYVDRPVVDQTGLAGRYDFTLVWTPDQMLAAGANATTPTGVDAPPDLFLAMQQQLGLKLDAVKIATEVLAIDKVEKPSDN